MADDNASSARRRMEAVIDGYAALALAALAVWSRRASQRVGEEDRSA